MPTPTQWFWPRKATAPNSVLFDDAELESIGEKYANGTMLTGEVKARLIQVLTELTQAHQKRRAEVTEEVLDHFFSVRPLEF